MAKWISSLALANLVWITQTNVNIDPGGLTSYLLGLTLIVQPLRRVVVGRQSSSHGCLCHLNQCLLPHGENSQSWGGMHMLQSHQTWVWRGTDLFTSVFCSFLFLPGYLFWATWGKTHSTIWGSSARRWEPFFRFSLIGDPIGFQADSNCTRALILDKVVWSHFPTRVLAPSSEASEQHQARGSQVILGSHAPRVNSHSNRWQKS